MAVLAFILLIIATVFAFFPSASEREKKVTYVTVGAVLMVAAVIMAPIGKDYRNYIILFESAISGDSMGMEPTFVLFSKISSVITGGPGLMFFMYAILGVGIKLYSITKLTRLEFLSLAIYTSSFFLLHEVTQLRAGVASGLLLLTIPEIQRRNGKKFLIYSVLAILFHRSALLVLPLWLLSTKPRKWLLALTIPVGYLIYFSGADLISISIPIQSVQDKLTTYQALQDIRSDFVTINVFNIIHVLKIVIFYFLLFFYDRIESENKYVPILMKIWAFSLASLAAFAVLPVAAFRISEFLGIVEIITLPMIYYCIQPKWCGRLVVVLLALALFYIMAIYSKLLI